MSQKFVTIRYLLDKLCVIFNIPTSRANDFNSVEGYLKVWLVRYNLKHQSDQIYLHTRIHSGDTNYNPIKPNESALDDYFGEEVFNIESIDFNICEHENIGFLLQNWQQLLKAIQNDKHHYITPDGHYLKDTISISQQQFEKINSLSNIKNIPIQKQREEALQRYLKKHSEIGYQNIKMRQWMLWEALSDEFPSLFTKTIKDDETVKKFFVTQKFITFKKGRLPKQ